MGSSRKLLRSGGILSFFIFLGLFRTLELFRFRFFISALSPASSEIESEPEIADPAEFFAESLGSGFSRSVLSGSCFSLSVSGREHPPAISAIYPKLKQSATTMPNAISP
ncbi:MAG: hypothetical protein HDR48_00470 [Bacteroides sp.]|nr:hypothetical protein [Bacteroides sp.]